MDSKKSNYFEKYRVGLQKITSQMKSKSSINKQSLSNSMKSSKLSIQDHSDFKIIDEQIPPSRKENIKRTVVIQSSSDANYMRKELFKSIQDINTFKTIPINEGNEQDKKAHSKLQIKGQKRNTLPIQKPIMINRLQYIVQSKLQKKIQTIMDSKLLQAKGQKQITVEIQCLLEQVENNKLKIIKIDNLIDNKKIISQKLQAQLNQQTLKFKRLRQMNYSQKILAIETRVKFKKQIHEEQMNRLVNQKNAIHSQNVQLSKSIQLLQQQLQILTKQYEKSQNIQSMQHLLQKQQKMNYIIDHLQQKCEEWQIKANSNQGQKDLSYIQYQKYLQIYKKVFIGKQISIIQDIIKQRNNKAKYKKQIYKKTINLKNKKIENMLLNKKITDLIRLKQYYAKEKQLIIKDLNSFNVEKKVPGFKEDQK